jgi:hypothetical protein
MAHQRCTSPGKNILIDRRLLLAKQTNQGDDSLQTPLPTNGAYGPDKPCFSGSIANSGEISFATLFATFVVLERSVH